MSEPETPPVEEAEPKQKKKGGGLIVTIVVAVVLTLVAGGGGWFIGGMLAGKFITQEKKDEMAKQAAALAAVAAADAKGGGEKKKPGEDNLPHLAAQETNVVALEPITSNLAYPSDTMLRLDVALVFDGKPDDKIGEAVHQDIMAYLRTVSLQQIEGSRGFEYLHEDIKERAEIRSEGHVKDVLFRAFLIQ